MTTLTGQGIEFYRWAAIYHALKLEISMRPSGMRSAMLKHGWPGIRKELGLPPASMTIKALRVTLHYAEIKLEEVRKRSSWRRCERP